MEAKLFYGYKFAVEPVLNEGPRSLRVPADDCCNVACATRKSVEQKFWICSDFRVFLHAANLGRISGYPL